MTVWVAGRSRCGCGCGAESGRRPRGAVPGREGMGGTRAVGGWRLGFRAGGLVAGRWRWPVLWGHPGEAHQQARAAIIFVAWARLMFPAAVNFVGRSVSPNIHTASFPVQVSQTNGVNPFPVSKKGRKNQFSLELN